MSSVRNTRGRGVSLTPKEDWTVSGYRPGRNTRLRANGVFTPLMLKRLHDLIGKRLQELDAAQAERN